MTFHMSMPFSGLESYQSSIPWYTGLICFVLLTSIILMDLCLSVMFLSYANAIVFLLYFLTCLSMASLDLRLAPLSSE